MKDATTENDVIAIALMDRFYQHLLCDALRSQTGVQMRMIRTDGTIATVWTGVRKLSLALPPGGTLTLIADCLTEDDAVRLLDEFPDLRILGLSETGITRWQRRTDRSDLPAPHLSVLQQLLEEDL